MHITLAASPETQALLPHTLSGDGVCPDRKTVAAGGPRRHLGIRSPDAVSTSGPNRTSTPRPGEEVSAWMAPDSTISPARS
jgi:hypothetical protein